MMKGSRKLSLLTVVLTLAGTTVLLGSTDGTKTQRVSQPPHPSKKSTRQRKLGDAARHIRLRWPLDRKVPITNKNLPSFSRRGTLTTVTSREKSSHGAATHMQTSTLRSLRGLPSHLTNKKKEYWQNRYRSYLARMRALKKRLTHLNSEIPRLWNQFYARDDPAYRDGVIKPKLDAALAARKRVKARLHQEEAVLPKLLEEARRNSVPPGWFRGLKP